MSEKRPNNIEGIRFGICARPDQIEAAAQAGYDYVELDLNDVLRLDETAYRAMAAEMQTCGVYAEVVCGLLPGNVPILGENVSAKCIHAALDRSFELARALGAELALFDCPAERMLPLRFDPAMAWRQLGNFIRMLQSYAADAGLRVALRCPDRYGCLLAAGITSMIGLQAFINMGVVTGILPTTGLPLPFFSAGGTSVTMIMAAVGILLSISRASGRRLPDGHDNKGERA